MYLKSIEVHGFKSFAKKINLEFREGITGIVGPNGSGKSNVADAVRWVLGEQRIKQLRGGNMQDVIFAGTEMRKPLSYASVSITLDNSDHQLSIAYDEVTVTRRLYRSGESEYAINGTTCRLKDINELFYDTGIGKEGYSIIGQGQIDRILSGKPEERRELFDEAAGIVKFKRRKNLSMKKLEEERQNLVRVTDILSEIEKQIVPLEKQAEVAKEYLKMRDELKHFDINMFLSETERIKEDIKVQEENLNNIDTQIQQSNQRYEVMKQEYESAAEEITAADLAIEELRTKLNETSILSQQYQGQIEVLREQINTVIKSDQYVSQRIEQIQQDIADRKLIQKESQDSQAALKAELDQTEADVEQARSELAEVQIKIYESEQELNDNKENIISTLNDRIEIQSEIQRLNSILNQNQIRENEISEQSSLHNYNIGKLKSDIETFTEKKDALLQQKNETEQKIQGNQKNIEQLQSKIAEQTNVLQEGQSKYHRESSRLDALKNMTERYDGYGNSIRRVMEQKKNAPGLLGVVADIIKTDKKHEVAIETALGGNIQNIVTDNEQTAKKMIEFLKQNRFGRATFLPLTNVKANSLLRNQDALKESGVIGLASTLVHVEDQYRDLAVNLLGRTIVVEHIDIGIRLSKKYQYGLRIVTIEGELLNPGGSITGGAFKNTSNLLGRRREIDELELTVSKQRSKVESLQKSIENDKVDRAKYYDELRELTTKQQQFVVELNTCEVTLQQKTIQLNDTMDVHKKMCDELVNLKNSSQQVYSKTMIIENTLKNSHASEQDFEEEIGEINKAIQALRGEEAKAVERCETINLRLAGIKQKHEFAWENQQRIVEEIQKLENEIAELETDRGQASDEILEKEERISGLKQSIEESKALLQTLQTGILESTEKKEELSHVHKSLIDSRENISKELNDLDKEKFRLSSKKETLEEQSEKQITYMWEEYELTYSKALELRDSELTDLSFMRKQVQRLKSEIKALGSVNVNAIEDYKEQSERYHFLKTQYDDLVEAEATLLNIIEELDQAMREQFKNQFSLIQKEYDAVFKQLFGGGKGILELMEDADILEAGVKIIAQPPGKKLQNMMQLSGGEKALTAIALLFAIQNLKPSPFCLLDEIEAALDESNVTRFAQYLHKLTKHTQFIVITHRRGTMAATDRLYGITMQEKGVSTLVSVDLLDDKLDN